LRGVRRRGLGGVLLLLKEKADRGEIRLTAAHFDHRIRSASGEDAGFVRNLCGALCVPLVEGSADVPALAKAERIGLETAARKARGRFCRTRGIRPGRT
jgi:tRNA(Ile)-lysidine synthase